MLRALFRGESNGGVVGVGKLHSGVRIPVFLLRGPVDPTPVSDRLLEETEVNLC